MAGRKSKFFVENNIKELKWNVGIYIRLSQEDEDNNGDKKESNSITNQKLLLEEYILDKKELYIFDTYIDDGYTGTNFERPGFQKMLDDIKKEKINCIIVKDLSRLGRNYIEVGNYIEKIFPMLNVRFISVNDNIDSYKNPSSVNTIIVPFKNLINDEYCRDTSMKIVSSLNGKKRKGEFVGAFPSYGYIKSKTDKHKLIVDDEAAEIVRMIFKWNVEDCLGKVAICKKLNELGILNPTGHKKIELHQNYNNKGNDYTWTPSTIRNILKNEIYIGNTVQGKRKVKSYKIHKMENVPQEQWIKVENTHEAIISKELFERAQMLGKKDVRMNNDGEVSKWAGILKCGDCKKAMNKKISRNGYGKKYEYYICSTYRQKSSKMCSLHKIRIEKLEEAVKNEINNQLGKCKKINEIIETLQKENEIIKKKQTIEEHIIKKKMKIEKINKLKLELYEDWKNEDITKEEYKEYKQKYEFELSNIKRSIEKIEEEMKLQIENLEIKNRWINEFKKNKKIEKLTREVIETFIEKIYIFENNRMQIIFKFNSNVI